MSLQIYTSANLNYAPQTAVLLESIRRFEPSAHVVLLFVDDVPIDGSWESYLSSFDEVITARELLGDRHDSWMAPYSVIEACTSVKGPALEFLLERGGEVIYLDPDTALFAPLTRFCDQLAHCSILLTPHQLQPADVSDVYLADEIDALRYGTYNFGVFGVRSTPEGKRFAHWWSQRLATHSIDDASRGLFTDQKWADLIPVFFPDSAIHREAGMNVASWNLHHRPFRINSDGDYLVEDSPLVLYHFSKITHLGKTATLLKLRNNPLVADLIRYYLERLEYWQHQIHAK